MTDDRVYNEAEIKGLLPVPVISEIPNIVTADDERVSKRKAWLGWAVAGLVVATILAGSAFSYLRS
jgi:polysaccharide biosynthesis transport protein